MYSGFYGLGIGVGVPSGLFAFWQKTPAGGGARAVANFGVFGELANVRFHRLVGQGQLRSFEHPLQVGLVFGQRAVFGGEWSVLKSPAASPTRDVSALAALIIRPIKTAIPHWLCRATTWRE